MNLGTYPAINDVLGGHKRKEDDGDEKKVNSSPAKKVELLIPFARIKRICKTDRVPSSSFAPAI
jgi:hypothetical protein